MLISKKNGKAQRKGRINFTGKGELILQSRERKR
jgi:hypothetical protein